MKRLLIALVILALCIPVSGMTAAKTASITNSITLGYNTSVELMRLEKRDDGLIAKPAAGFGAGLTFKHTKLGAIAFNLPEFILTTETDSNNQLNVLIGADIGFLCTDDAPAGVVRIGGGWMGGDWMGLISLGL